MAISDLDKFLLRVDKTDSCWNYIGPTDAFGYGFFYSKGKTWRAHRFSYNFLKEIIKTDLCVLHRCDNPKCVNPEHLFLGTKGDNVRDMVAKNRNVTVAKLSELDVFCIKALRNWSKFSTVEIAKEFNISTGMVSNICNGKSWKKTYSL